MERAQAKGWSVSRSHLRWLNPLPNDLAEVLGRFDKILVPELNLGQLSLLIRARLLHDVISYPKIQGQPFKVSEVFGRIAQLLGHADQEMN